MSSRCFGSFDVATRSFEMLFSETRCLLGLHFAGTTGTVSRYKMSDDLDVLDVQKKPMRRMPEKDSPD